jgi:murein L,D-transpeptidase YcbB/YkuD
LLSLAAEASANINGGGLAMRIGTFVLASKRRFTVVAGLAAALSSGAAMASAERVAPRAPLVLASALPSFVSMADKLAPAALEPVVEIAPAQGPLAEMVGAWAKAPLVGPKAAERRALREAVAAFYAARDFAPLWIVGDAWTPARRSAMQRLRSADEDGLDLSAYGLPSEAAPGAQGELELSEMVVAYAMQASGSRVDPKKLGKLLGMSPSLPSAETVLAAVSTASDADGALRGFNPSHDGYAALRAKLAALRSARAASERVAKLESGAPVLSDTSPRRGFEAYAPAELARIEAEIVANMERWRWMPRELAPTRVEVNIPQFELTLVRDGVAAYRSRVMVGKPSTPTPVFSNSMRFVTVNPYWNVPPSILKNEMLAKHGGDLSYLTQRGFEVSYRNGQPSVRQRPGARNALGLVKFIFPNEYSVYMHDTPSRDLFARAKRAFSHGCVRVDQPFRLAEAVLGSSSGWSEARVRSLVGGSERTIPLAAPLPVHIEYFTAFVDETGALQMREDIYGYSAKVRAALGLL